MAAERKKILVINPKKDEGEAVCENLKKYDFSCSLADSFQTTKESLESNSDLDAILVDASFNPQTAVKMISFLRKHVEGQTILFVTDGYLDDVTLVKLEDAGVIRKLAAREPQEKAAAIKKVLLGRSNHYDVNVINCFVKTTNDVLEYYTDELPNIRQVSIKTNAGSRAGYSTGISMLTSDASIGSISLTCTKAFMNFVTPRVIGTEPKHDFPDEVIEEATSEMCDQIFGKSGMLLGRFGHHFDVGLPSVLIGPGHEILHQGDAPVLQIPFRMAQADFAIEFCLQNFD